MFRNVFFFRRKQQLHARLVHAVRDVFRGEHVRCGDKYDAHFAIEKYSKYLGKEKFRQDEANEKNEIGIVRGLAWTSVGGDTLQIEVNTMPGKEIWF